MKRNSNHSGCSSKDNIFSRFFTKLRTSMDNQNTMFVVNFLHNYLIN